MWDCVECACRAIAASLRHCPVCRKERDVPKTTTDSGASNAWADAEAEALPGEPAAAGVPEAAEPEPEPEPFVLKADLQDQARELGLPVSGTKAQLADAVASAPAPVPAEPEPEPEPVVTAKLPTFPAAAKPAED